MSFALLD